MWCGRRARKPLAAVVGIAAASLLLACCGSEAKTLSEAQTKRLLIERLPYRFHFRPVKVPEGASGAVAGYAVGPHRTVLRFGISLGSGKPVSIGPQTDFSAITGGPTFWFTDDSQIKVNGKVAVPSRFRTDAQYKESGVMAAEIEDRLCLATTGDHCPV